MGSVDLPDDALAWETDSAGLRYPCVRGSQDAYLPTWQWPLAHLDRALIDGSAHITSPVGTLTLSWEVCHWCNFRFACGRIHRMACSLRLRRCESFGRTASEDTCSGGFGFQAYLREIDRSRTCDVDGQLVTELGVLATRGLMICVDGQQIRRSGLAIIILHKPAGYLSILTLAPATIVARPGGSPERLYPVGRLD